MSSAIAKATVVFSRFIEAPLETEFVDSITATESAEARRHAPGSPLQFVHDLRYAQIAAPDLLRSKTF